MDQCYSPFAEYFPSHLKWAVWKIYYPPVVDVLQLSEEQAMRSMFCFLRVWALNVVSDLPPCFWR